MSWLKRLVTRRDSDYREETQKRVWDDHTLDANTPSTAIPDLILLDPQDKYDAFTLAQVAREDPIARYVTATIANNVWDDWFYLAKRGSEEEIEQNTEIQRELERMNAKAYFMQCHTAERIFGNAWLDVIPADRGSDYREDMVDFETQPKIARLDVYTPLNTSVIAWSSSGQPETLRVVFKHPDGTEDHVDIPAQDTIPIRIRPFGDRSYRGVSVLTPIWDALTYIRQVLFAMGWYSIKVGIGVFYVRVRGALTDNKRKAAQAVLQGISTKRGIIYSDLVIDEFGFIQASAGATSFPQYVDNLMTQVAIGTGIPKDILTGMAGTNEASAAAMDLRNSVINTEQQRQEIYIRELVRRMGYEDLDYDIIWHVRFERTEEQEAKVLMRTTQADAQALDYMTINEVRKRRNLPPIEGGDELLSLKNDIQVGFSPMNPPNPKNEDKNNNPQGVQV